jgi:AcrR family transcriptional regulator
MRTRDQVLDAAAEEFALHGYAGTNLATVAVRTGMTKGALYGHFPSKRALASALVNQSTETWNGIRRSVARASADTTLQGLALAVARQMKDDTRFRAALRLAADCTLPVGGAPDLTACIRREMAAAARHAQRNHDRHSPLTTHSPEAVAHLLLAVTYGLSFAAEREAPGRSPATADSVWKLLLSALHLEDLQPHAFDHT